MSLVIFPLCIPHLLPVSSCQGGSVGGQNDTNKIKRGLRFLQSAAGTAGVTVARNGRIDRKRHQEANVSALVLACCWVDSQRTFLPKISRFIVEQIHQEEVFY